MGSGISSSKKVGSKEVIRRINNSQEACRRIINNSTMINNVLMGLPTPTITKGEFINKVDKVAQDLSEPYKSAFLREKDAILTCVQNGNNTFDIETVGRSSSNEMLDFTITITPNATGGRRSKTYRTKKGKRKGTKRRRRGYRRF